MNNCAKCLALGTVLLASATGAKATWYTVESEFLGAMNASYYLEDFSGWTNGDPLNGSQLTWSGPGANGFGWEAYAELGLWSSPSALSTNSASADIVFTFTGSPVRAFGMNIADTDFNANPVPGDSTIYLSNGQSMTVSLGATEGFLGWVGADVLTGAIINTVGNPNIYNWVQADHVYTGTAVPEPASVIALGFGALGFLRRRCKRA